MDDFWQTIVRDTLRAASREKLVTKSSQVLEYLRQKEFPLTLYTTHSQRTLEIWEEITGLSPHLPPTPASLVTPQADLNSDFPVLNGGIHLSNGGGPRPLVASENDTTPICIYLSSHMTTSPLNTQRCEGDLSYIYSSALSKNSLTQDDDGTILIRWSYLLPADKSKSRSWQLTRCKVIDDSEENSEGGVDVLFGSDFRSVPAKTTKDVSTESQASDSTAGQDRRPNLSPVVPKVRTNDVESCLDTRCANDVVAVASQLIYGVTTQIVNHGRGQLQTTPQMLTNGWVSSPQVGPAGCPQIPSPGHPSQASPAYMRPEFAPNRSASASFHRSLSRASNHSVDFPGREPHYPHSVAPVQLEAGGAERDNCPIERIRQNPLSSDVKAHLLDILHQHAANGSS